MLLIAGPCSAESLQQVLATAKAVAGIGADVFRAGVWKPRTKPGGFEGAGASALGWLAEAQQTAGIPAATEVANPRHLELAVEAGLRWFWIGARTSTNPFAVQEIADAIVRMPDVIRRKLTVMVKNPVNPDLELWIGAIERIRRSGTGRVAAIHRGFSSYGARLYRNEPQWAIPIELKRRLPGLPLICDPSHIGGSRDLIAPLSQQAMDMGADGLMIETHPSPDLALSDARQQVTPERLQEIMGGLTPKSGDAAPDNLDELRRHIDYIDDELLQLLARRMEVSREIGEYKKSHRLPVVQPERYNRLMRQRVDDAAKLGLPTEFTQRLLALIHEESVRQQF